MTHALFERLLLQYAAGTAEPAAALLAAASAALNAEARRTVARYEALGGRVIDDSDEAEVRCLEAVLLRIDACGVPAPAPRPALPPPLARVLRGCREDGGACWGRPRRGVARIAVKCSGAAQLHLMRLAPGTSVPAHAHAGPEITLVLEGEYEDLGRVHRRGDVCVIADPALVHAPRAGASGCVCLVLAEGGRRFANPWHVVLEFFS